jgi:hypothetical protein
MTANTALWLGGMSSIGAVRYSTGMTCSNSSDVHKTEVHEERSGDGIAQKSALF